MNFTTRLKKTGIEEIQGVSTTISFEHEDGKAPDRVQASGSDYEGMNINSSFNVEAGTVEIQVYGAKTAPVDYLIELEAQFKEIKASFEPIN